MIPMTCHAGDFHSGPGGARKRFKTLAPQESPEAAVR